MSIMREQMIESEITACNKLLLKHGAIDYIKGSSVEAYVATCLFNKTALIEELGGWRRHFRVSLDKMPISHDEIWRAWVDNGSCNYYGFNDLYSNFELLTSKYAKESALVELSRNPMEYIYERGYRPIAGYPQLTFLKLRKGQSIPSAHLKQLRTYLHEPRFAPIISSWERFYEKLGQFWSLGSQDYDVTISAAPSTFLRLGHMGENSCYRFGHEWQQSKGYLAQLPRSVAYIFYEASDAEQPMHDRPRGGGAKIIGRAWGMLGNSDCPGMSIGNIYLLQKERAVAAATHAAAQLQGVDISAWDGSYDDEDSYPHRTSHHEIYINNDTKVATSHHDLWTDWHKQQASSIKMIQVAEMKEEEDDRVICGDCGDRCENDHANCSDCGVVVCADCYICDDISDNYFCNNCRTAATCSDCGIASITRNLIELHNGDYACQECVVVCEVCNVNNISADMVNCASSNCDNQPLCIRCTKLCADCAAVYCPTHADQLISNLCTTCQPVLAEEPA